MRGPRIRVRLLFAWYDLWIGAYWDRKTRTLYVLPLPCLGAAITFFGRRAEDLSGGWTGDDWMAARVDSSVVAEYLDRRRRRVAP